MSTAPSLEGPRNVLLVEDNPGDARLVQERLKCGWTRNVSVTHVTRLDEGAAHLAAHGADCVLLDLSHRLRPARPLAPPERTTAPAPTSGWLRAASSTSVRLFNSASHLCRRAAAMNAGNNYGTKLEDATEGAGGTQQQEFYT